MQQGLSIGWFDTWGVHPQPQALVSAIERLLSPRLRRTRAWPFAVASLRWEHRDIGVSYALVGGAIPLHMDALGSGERGGQTFQLVMAVENRPALLYAQHQDGTLSEAILRGTAPPTEQQIFYAGGVELKAGMAVHFDITRSFHGIIGLPIEPGDGNAAPKAVIVQVTGFGASEIGKAIAHAASCIAIDEAGSR